MGDLRRITNKHSSRPWSDAYDGQQFFLNPGQQALVPEEAVALWFGNNAFVDRPNRAFRKEEYNRLRIRYGAFDDEEIWLETRPEFIEVADLNGNQLETVLSDPTGVKVTEATTTVDEKAQMLDLIRQQQDDLKVLREEFKKASRAQEATAAGGTLKEDKPTTPPSRKARASTT